MARFIKRFTSRVSLRPFTFRIFYKRYAFYKEIKKLCKLFADDTNLIGVIRNPLDLTTLQGNIDCLMRWAEDWMMDINVDKCRYIVFNNKYFNINLKMNAI